MVECTHGFTDKPPLDEIGTDAALPAGGMPGGLLPAWSVGGCNRSAGYSAEREFDQPTHAGWV
ncbi:MAG: hypothetical protein AB9891_15350 [Anaerolineaceae bacterium]